NWKLENILNEMLLANYPKELSRLQNLMNFETEILSTEGDRDPENGLTFFIPYIVTMMFYIIILGSSSLMLNSITNEKTNRVMEILMTSINPTQMLTGKIVALGIVGLMQTIIWSVSGFLLLRLSGRTMDLASSFQLPISILFWGILFFIAGYTLYASLMAGLGAMVPNLKEASQATTILVIPMIIPLMFMGAIIDKPNGMISLILSLFPLTAPVTMMTRLASGNVPLWQILLSLFLIFAFSYLVIRSVSNLFRAQTLLSGQEFKLKYFFNALRGKFSI
ncbi:MAG: ABC transporter permease, partial [Anaerolineaceae bacterium]|nr:ABC transporter permease [Anaerolineaceae bacterium]